jgi:polar amino acid transport system permease protein
MEHGKVQFDGSPEAVRTAPEGERVRRFMGIAAQAHLAPAAPILKQA